MRRWAPAICTGPIPSRGGGAMAVLNPRETLARCLSITGVAGGTGGAFVIQGYDALLQPMAEQITVGAGAVTAFGLKTWKYIVSVTPQFTDAHNYSVGWGDTFGFHTRSDFWEYANIFYNGGFAVSSTGWLAGVKTIPATRTTG